MCLLLFVAVAKYLTKGNLEKEGSVTKRHIETSSFQMGRRRCEQEKTEPKSYRTPVGQIQNYLIVLRYVSSWQERHKYKNLKQLMIPHL